MVPKDILEIGDIRDRRGRIRPRFPRKGAPALAPDGRFRAIRPNGQTLLEITYRRGIVHGPYREYWSNGQVACIGQFRDGKQDGIWHFYREDGSLMETIHFETGNEQRGEGGEGEKKRFQDDPMDGTGR